MPSNQTKNRPMSSAACSRLYSKDSAWAGIFARRVKKHKTTFKLNLVHFFFWQQNTVRTVTAVTSSKHDIIDTDNMAPVIYFIVEGSILTVGNTVQII